MIAVVVSAERVGSPTSGVGSASGLIDGLQEPVGWPFIVGVDLMTESAKVAGDLFFAVEPAGEHAIELDGPERPAILRVVYQAQQQHDPLVEQPRGPTAKCRRFVSRVTPMWWENTETVTVSFSRPRVGRPSVQRDAKAPSPRGFEAHGRRHAGSRHRAIPY
jgi:hypothetical protein